MVASSDQGQKSEATFECGKKSQIVRYRTCWKRQIVRSCAAKFVKLCGECAVNLKELCENCVVNVQNCAKIVRQISSIFVHCDLYSEFKWSQFSPSRPGLGLLARITANRWRRITGGWTFQKTIHVTSKVYQTISKVKSDDRNNMWRSNKNWSLGRLIQYLRACSYNSPWSRPGLQLAPV